MDSGTTTSKSSALNAGLMSLALRSSLPPVVVGFEALLQLCDMDVRMYTGTDAGCGAPSSGFTKQQYMVLIAVIHCVPSWLRSSRFGDLSTDIKHCTSPLSQLGSGSSDLRLTTPPLSGSVSAVGSSRALL